MAIFTPFSKQVQDELRFRKSFSNIQTSLIPHLRVTSLITGTLPQLNGLNLRGLTLGPENITNFSQLEDQVNVSGQKCSIGVTYTNGQPQIVEIPSNKVNLPMPGIENVDIDVQKGGFIFKATVDIKCYGKEQYDFLYQTVTRPGTPILIEYGHTRDKNDIVNGQLIELDDLGDTEEGPGFFNNLTRNKIELYDQMLKGFRGPISTRTGGAIIGMVTNFDVKLNANNEYEIKIDLINSLEWFYNLQNENTFISYGDDNFDSRSIRELFGYDPEREIADRVFTSLLHRVSKQDTGVLYFRNTSVALDLDVDYGESGPYAVMNIQNNPDRLYVSLDYFLNDVLDVILQNSYFDVSDSVEGMKTGTSIISPESFCTYWKDLRSINTDVVINNKTLYENQRLIGSATEDSDDDLPYTYATYFYARRYENYKNRYYINDHNRYIGTVKHQKMIEDIQSANGIRIERSDPAMDTEFKQLFTINPRYGPQKTRHPLAEIYGAKRTPNPRGDSDFDNQEQGFKTHDFKGIYIQYLVIRNAFLESDTLSQAIVKILNSVNRASNGTLNLKMRFVDIKTTELESKFELYIYDEGSTINSVNMDNVYTFFEDNISEAISYDLSFNLPAAVSSIIIANDFQSKYAAGGDLKNKMFIDYGYDNSISKLIGITANINNAITDPIMAGIYQPDTTTGEAQETSQTSEEAKESIEKKIGTSNMLGYLELSPPSMLGSIVASGLHNTLPSAARVTITLQGIAGIKWGQLFKVEKILPAPYDKNALFMVVGYDHQINSDGWYTKVSGQLIASNPNGPIQQNISNPWTTTSNEMLNDIRLIRPWDIVTLKNADPRWVNVIREGRSRFENRGYSFSLLLVNNKNIKVRVHKIKSNGSIAETYSVSDARVEGSESRLHYEQLFNIFKIVGRESSPEAEIGWGVINNPDEYYIIR